MIQPRIPMGLLAFGFAVGVTSASAGENLPSFADSPEYRAKMKEIQENQRRIQENLALMDQGPGPSPLPAPAGPERPVRVVLDSSQPDPIEVNRVFIEWTNVLEREDRYNRPTPRDLAALELDARRYFGKFTPVDVRSPCYSFVFLTEHKEAIPGVAPAREQPLGFRLSLGQKEVVFRQSPQVSLEWKSQSPETCRKASLP